MENISTSKQLANSRCILKRKVKVIGHSFIITKLNFQKRNQKKTNWKVSGKNNTEYETAFMEAKQISESTHFS